MGSCILVVEDQADNRQILRDLLGNAGFDLIEAENGEEALAALAKQRPDLNSYGHPATHHGRLRGYTAHQGRPGDEGHPHHCSDLIRVDRR